MFDWTPLADGARVGVGRARLTFFESEQAADMAALAPAPSPDAAGPPPPPPAGGIVLRCTCGARVLAPAAAAGMTVRCPACELPLPVPARHAAPRTAPPPPPPRHPGDVPAAWPQQVATPPITTAVATAVSAKPRIPHGVCSVCHWEIHAGDEQTVCPSCGLVFHAECWAENRGCSTYGCPQVGVLDPDYRPADPATAHRADEGELPEATARNFPWGLVLLACSVAGGALGSLTFGVPPLAVAVLAVLRLFKRQSTGERLFILLAVLISLSAAAAGVWFSCIYWLGFELVHIPLG